MLGSALLAAGLGIAVSLSACGEDTTSSAALTGAAQAMQSLSGYTFEGDVTAGALKFHISGAFNAPNRVSATITPTGAAPTKWIVIGTRAYELKAGSSTWTVAPTGTSGGLATDPRGAFTALSQAQQVSSAADGYTFTVSGPASGTLVQGSSTVTGTAKLQAGRIVGLSYRSDNPAVSVALVYGAFNSAPSITPPAA